MVIGIGCDVVNIDRIDKLLKYKNFLYKHFTESEVNMFELYLGNKKNYLKKIASNFSVKEALYKSISNEIDLYKFIDVEVLRDNYGKPYVNLYNRLSKFNNGYNLHVTISNEVNIVTSFVILEKINK